jgi:diaminopimelate decarboxylase
MQTLDDTAAGRLREVAETHGTPCYVYDAARIRAQIARLRAFDVIRYAQKACSNVHILRLMRDQGVCVDAVSAGELERALRAGYTGEGDPAGVVYTADVVDAATAARLGALGVPLNAGSLDMLDAIGRAGRGHPVWLRINPGFGHGHSQKTSTGGESSKHGIWYEHVDAVRATLDAHSLRLAGLHMHIGSGSDMEHLSQVAQAMLGFARMLDRDVPALSAGGGLPIAYREGDPSIDVDAYYRCWDAARRELAAELEHPVSLEVEPGRFLVAESGYLVAEVLAVKAQGKKHFVLVDAGFNDLMRPAMYGSYHDISVVRRAGGLAVGETQPTVLGGPLCESGDVFTQESGGYVVPRDLPAACVGDFVVLHDAGAYGAAMASNYNSRPHVPEVLLDGGETRLIRRRQTMDELLALEAV